LLSPEKVLPEGYVSDNTTRQACKRKSVHTQTDPQCDPRPLFVSSNTNTPSTFTVMPFIPFNLPGSAPPPLPTLVAVPQVSTVQPGFESVRTVCSSAEGTLVALSIPTKEPPSYNNFQSYTCLAVPASEPSKPSTPKDQKRKNLLCTPCNIKPAKTMKLQTKHKATVAQDSMTLEEPETDFSIDIEEGEELKKIKEDMDMLDPGAPVSSEYIKVEPEVFNLDESEPMEPNTTDFAMSLNETSGSVGQSKNCAPDTSCSPNPAVLQGSVSSGQTSLPNLVLAPTSKLMKPL